MTDCAVNPLRPPVPLTRMAQGLRQLWEHTGWISKCPCPWIAERKSEDHPSFAINFQSLCDEFYLKVTNEP